MLGENSGGLCCCMLLIHQADGWGKPRRNRGAMMSKSKRLKFNSGMAVASALMVASGGSALAQSLESPAHGIAMGPTTVYPALGLGIRYDDNIFFTPTKKSSWISILAPQARIEASSYSGVKYGANAYIED